MSMLRNNDTKHHDAEELKPLTKEKALASIGKFRKELGLEDVHTTKERIKDLLEKSGSLSEEVTRMRLEEM